MFTFNFQGPLIHKWAQPLTGTLHMQHVIMRAQYGCPKCMHTTATCQSPKIKVYEGAQEGISLHHAFGKSFGEAKAAGNKCKRQMGEPFPTCQGPWGTCIRYQGCTHRFVSFQGLCVETDWERLCL